MHVLARSLRIEVISPQLLPEPESHQAAVAIGEEGMLGQSPLADYTTFTKTIDDCLNNLNIKYKEQMETLLTLNFQTFEDEPVLAA